MCAGVGKVSYRGWEGVTEADLRKKSSPPPAKSKYRAVPTDVEGIRFASKREADRYLVLRDEQARGMIRHLELQPQYPICVVTPNHISVVVAVYIADFRYIRNHSSVTEDAKGLRTPIYILKKKLVEALYGITILET